MQAPDVGQRIRRIRQKLGLTQARFAQRLGITKISVSRHEAGRIPRSDLLDAIARLGGVSVEWLLHGQTSEAPAQRDALQLVGSNLAEPVRTLVRFFEQRAPSVEALPRRYRRRYEERVNELITRIRQDLEEYQKGLEAESRLRRSSGRRKTKGG
jgi:transcriptional regulator with XRE-family HTH domain